MQSSRLLIAALAAVACGAPSSVATSPAPTPSPATSAPAAATPRPNAPSSTVPRVAVPEAPRDWQLLDETVDHVPGISVERAMTQLLAGKAPKQTVLVAIIDNGIDTTHPDLCANLWTNPKEVGGNGKDDDNNGFVDDVHGWNFIGGKDGKDVQYDLLEVTRLYVRCSKTPNAGPTAKLPVPDAATCKRATDEYQKQREQNQNMQQQVGQIATGMTRANEVLHRAMGPESLTKAKVTAFQPTSQDAMQAKVMWLRLADARLTPEELEDAKKDVESKAKYGLSPDYDPRTIVGDDLANVSERKYGNAHVMGPEAKRRTDATLSIR